MRASLPSVLLCGATILLLFLAAPLARAAEYPAPDALAVTVGYPETTQLSTGPQISYDVYVNFTRSAADSGTGTYNICREDTDGVPITCANNTAVTTIPNRPRWVSFHDTGAYNTEVDPWTSYWAYNVSLNLTTFNGVPTEKARVHLNISRDHDQVGPNATFNTSNIIEVSTVVVATTTTQGLSYFNFTHSNVDPNASTTGDFEYWIFEQFATAGTPPPPCSRISVFLHWCQPGTPSQLAGFYVMSPPNTGTSGNRSWQIDFGGTSPTYLSVDVTPVDNRTGLWGNVSCTTVIDMYQRASANACGVYTTIPGLNPLVPTPPNATFPGLNVAAFVNATGFTSEKAGFTLAAVFILLATLAGFAIAGGTGAGVAGALGTACTYTMGLMPAWFIIVLVSLSVAVVVFRFTTAGGRQGGSKGGRR